MSSRDAASPPPPLDAAPGAAVPADGAGPTVPPIDRRTRVDRRGGRDRRQRDVPVAHDRRSGRDRRAEAERRTPGRRGGEYELDAETLEFIHAVNAFKEKSGKSFPTWSDILGILRELGWERRP